VVNREGSLAAREKQKQVKDRFRAWLFPDPERTEWLVRLSNDYGLSLVSVLPGCVLQKLVHHDASLCAVLTLQVHWFRSFWAACAFFLASSRFGRVPAGQGRG